jgi:hypothetical protein
MKTVKVTKLNKAEEILVGMSVPEQKNGNVGVLVEDTMKDSGYKMSNGTGVDIPGLGAEVKTKGTESKSAYAMGSLHIDTIKSNDYDSSPIKEKCQTIFKVAHSQTFREITDARVLDFSKEFIQDKFRDAYDTARKKILAGDTSDYIKGHDNAWGYFERKKKNKVGTNNWAFRIPVNKMKELEGMAKSNIDKLFE